MSEIDWIISGGDNGLEKTSDLFRKTVHLYKK